MMGIPPPRREDIPAVKPKPLPDLRRLRVDVTTPIGTYAAGTLVEVLGGRRDTRKVRVCLDGPGFHLGKCRQILLPFAAVTKCALVNAARPLSGVDRAA